jgi:hypothetical protein
MPATYFSDPTPHTDLGLSWYDQGGTCQSPYYQWATPCKNGPITTNTFTTNTITTNTITTTTTNLHCNTTTTTTPANQYQCCPP